MMNNIIMLKNNLTLSYVKGKIFNSRGLGKKLLPTLSHPYPLPDKSQMVRGWGRSGFDILVVVICQQNGWCIFIMWWFSRVKFCYLRLKIHQ